MPTEILLLKDRELVSLSTEKFAEIREEIWEWVYGLLPKDASYKYFRSQYDDKFVRDSLTAQFWPSWNDFVECMNSGHVFSIITTRWHSKHAFKKAIKQMILAWHWWLDVTKLRNSLECYVEQANQNWDFKITLSWIRSSNDIQLIETYLKLCRFYPIKNKNVATEIDWIKDDTPIRKAKSLQNFIKYVNWIAIKIHSDVNELIVPVWFSDDDKWFIEVIQNEAQYMNAKIKTILTIKHTGRDWIISKEIIEV